MRVSVRRREAEDERAMETVRERERERVEKFKRQGNTFTSEIPW